MGLANTHSGGTFDAVAQGEFVTVGNFSDAIAAELARAKLESAGIEAQLGDEMTVSIDWQLTNALGGIRLRVVAGEAQAARAILRDTPEPPASAMPGEALNAREVRAERAAKMALFGCMFAPLLLYALGLVVGVLSEPGELRPMVRRQLQLSIALIFCALAAIVALGVFLFVGK